MTAVYRTDKINKERLRSLLVKDGTDQMIEYMERGYDNLSPHDFVKGLYPLAACMLVAFMETAFAAMTLASPSKAVSKETSTADLVTHAVIFTVSFVATIFFLGRYRQKVSQAKQLFYSARLDNLTRIEIDAYHDLDSAMKLEALPKLEFISCWRGQLHKNQDLMTYDQIANAEASIAQFSNEVTADYRRRKLDERPSLLVLVISQEN